MPPSPLGKYSVLNWSERPLVRGVSGRSRPPVQVWKTMVLAGIPVWWLTKSASVAQSSPGPNVNTLDWFAILTLTSMSWSSSLGWWVRGGLPGSSVSSEGGGGASGGTGGGGFGGAGWPPRALGSVSWS